MFQPKPPKSQKPDNLPLYFHRLHQITPDYNQLWTQPYRQIVIFDIGYENLCRRISRRHISPKKMEMIAFDKTNLKIESDEEDYRILLVEIESFLEPYREEYLKTHVVIIEWQLPINYKALRISTIILSYFYFLLKETDLKPIVVEMRSGFKDDYFPILKPLNQSARKDKCEELGKDLLVLSGDYPSLEIMEGGTSRKKKTKKQDDFADTLLMEEVYCRYSTSRGVPFPHYETTRKINLSSK